MRTSPAQRIAGALLVIATVFGAYFLSIPLLGTQPANQIHETATVTAVTDDPLPSNFNHELLVVTDAQQNDYSLGWDVSVVNGAKLTIWVLNPNDHSGGAVASQYPWPHAYNGLGIVALFVACCFGLWFVYIGLSLLFRKDSRPQNPTYLSITIDTYRL